MAIKDKVKKAAKALVKDEPKQSSTPSTTTPAAAAPVEPTSTPKAAPPTSIEMPKSNGKHATYGSTNGVKTPKTPQDEAIAFFSSGSDGQSVQVWELWLEDDGGPDEAKSVCLSSFLPFLDPSTKRICRVKWLTRSTFVYPLLFDLMS
jgi:hypothetical protein